MALQHIKFEVNEIGKQPGPSREIRLDQLLVDELPARVGQPVSKGQVRKLILAGAVYLNAKRVRIASKLIRPGARIEVYFDARKIEAHGLRPSFDYRFSESAILFEDSDLIAVDKPAGIPTQPTLDEARASLVVLKSDLLERGDATGLFAQERGDGLAALLGNLDQTVFGEPAYPSVEAKAAHLLYFVIKNHPFSDGNKRSAAFLFVDFLNRNGRLLDATGQPVINDIGLAALALLVAESAPAQKETMIRLIMNMLVPAPKK